MGLNLEATIGLNSEGFERGMERATDSLKELVIGAIGVATVEEAFHRTIETVTEFAETVKQGSERMNISTDEFQKLSYAAAKSNLDIKAVEGAFDRLDRAQVDALQGNEKIQEAFMKLGVSIEDIKSKSPDELFSQIGSEIEKTGTNAQRTAAMMEVFGRGAGELIPLLKELNENKDAGSAFVVSDRDITRLDDAKKKSAGIGYGLLSGLTTVAANLLHPFDTFAETLSNNLSSAGPIRDLKDKLDAQKQAAFYVSNGYSDELHDYRPNETQKKDHADALEVEKKITAEKEKQKLAGLSEGQKRIEMLKEIAQTERDIAGAPFEGLSETQTAELRLHLEVLKTQLKQMSRPAVTHTPTDSLLRVGNFLGSSRGVINSAQARLEQHAAATARNTQMISNTLATMNQKMGASGGGFGGSQDETQWAAN